MTFKTLIFFFLGLFLVFSVKAADVCSNKTGDARIVCLQAESDRLSSQSKTLSNQIAQ